MTPLPRLMVAPNGARRDRRDHPALPVSIEETVDCAVACHAAGADALHAHVRDEAARHVLDAGRYRELLHEMHRRVPSMAVQITTEAVGRYTPAEQRALVRAVRPTAVSVAWREMSADADPREADRFYAECAESDIAVQHILYGPDDVVAIASARSKMRLPPGELLCLLVLGSYGGEPARPEDLDGFVVELERLRAHGPVDWAVCAFGPHETRCLEAAYARGAALRVGFENGLHGRDGTLARDNAERVAEIAAIINPDPQD